MPSVCGIGKKLLTLQIHIIMNNIRNTIIDAIQDKKGRDICTINLSSILSAPAFDFVICQGKTPTQNSAIADNIIDMVREKCHRKPLRIDGMRNGQWIIVDFGDTMVHVFTPEYREFYNLEDLWIDGIKEEIPNLD